MKVEQKLWDETKGWTTVSPSDSLPSPQLVVAFGDRSALERPGVWETLRASYPSAQVIGCSTAGEICGSQVFEQRVCATAIHFEHSHVHVVTHPLPEPTQSHGVGETLGRLLNPDGLVHVFVLAEGVHVNGSELLRGLQSALPPGVGITGGLAGDGNQFERTIVCCNEQLRSRQVVMVGLYGSRLRIGFGSMGGWDTFGPERLITKSVGNVVHEIDGSPALELYKKYLGPYADGLPATGLLFPLALKGAASGQRVVRTILATDEATGGLVFAGDVPEGSYATLMKANVDRLIDGAHGAASASYEALGTQTPTAAILISCVGRKLVLKQRVEEEVESVQSVLGTTTAISGFYSYGEIAPFLPSAKCELHNQTMTITTLAER